ncbi:MAG: hypothetical protein ACMUIG_09285 [Thermoplasmatota archaeon]
MSTSIAILTLTAASIGFFHTLLGPDHYLPFIMMARAGKWSMKKTSLVTILCGIGHVLGSIVLGLIGIGLGLAVSGLEVFEGVRGDLAAWALIAFGFVYMVWGIKRAVKDRKHGHCHLKTDGKKSMTPWILFTIFVLGPCEPLIPLLMYPAYERSLIGVFIVAAVFSLVTISTMFVVVMFSSMGLAKIKVDWLEPYSHALAGAVIMISGMGIAFLGL